MKSFPLLLTLALLPASALAEQQCKFNQPQALELDLAGAKAVVFEVNSHDLRLQASPGAKAALAGRACASTRDLLEQLSLSQRKVGDKLVVTLERKNHGLDFNFSGNTYAYLDVSGTVPDTVLVQLKVGSGDASLAGAHSMSADVGSGDVTARDIKGLATAAVGSGDLQFDNIGALHLLSLGSGDARVKGVRGDARIDTVGSGDLELHGVQGNVSLERVGSGDVQVRDTRGNVSLEVIGSGDLEVHNAANLRVQRTGSGSIRHTGVSGSIELPKKR